MTKRANDFVMDDLNVKILQQQHEKSPTSLGNNNSALGDKASAISCGTNSTPNFSDSTKQSTENKKEIGVRHHAVS